MWEATYFNIVRQQRRPDSVYLYVHNVQREYSEELVQFRDMLKYAGIDLVVVKNESPGVLYGHAMYLTLERICAEVNDGLILKFDDDDYYGPGYVSGMFECYAAHPDAVLMGKHGFYTMFMDCRRKPMWWEAPNGNQIPYPRTSYLGGPTIVTPIRSYHEYPELRYDITAPFAIDSKYLALAKELTKEKWVDGWPPVYSTGPDDFILQRWIRPEHNHVWNPPELMKEDPDAA